MTLKEARELRDYVTSKSSVNCTVPLGHGPSDYFPMSVLSTGAHSWKSRQEFRDWWALRLREQRKAYRAYEALSRRRARSPIELMVDRACGLA